jgi:hypothetical protein
MVTSSRVRPGVRWVLQEAAQTAKKSPLFADTYGQLAHRRGRNIATVAVARRLLARCFHILKQLEVPPESSRRLGPGALVSLHEPATRPPGLTEQPGSGLHRHADPLRGPNGCMRANSATSSGPSRPTFRPRPTSPPANPRSHRRADPFTPLTRPDPWVQGDYAPARRGRSALVL